MNSKELEQAVKKLESNNSSVREGAIEELRKNGDERALVPLRRLRDSQGSFWRDFVLDSALIEIKNRLIKKLIQSRPWNKLLKILMTFWAMQDPEYPLKLARKSKLPLFPYLLIALFGGNKNTRLDAVTGLGQLGGEESADALLIALQDGKEEVRELAESQLKKIGPEAHNPILAELSREHCPIKTTLTFLLGELQDPRSVSFLFKLLEHHHQNLREEASKALTRFGEDAAAPLLNAIKQSEKDLSPEAIKTFRELSRYMSLDTISQLLKDSRFMIRMEAAAALGSLKQDTARDLLLQTLEDPEPVVRAQAASGLRQSASPITVEPLIKMLQDSDTGVRDEAAGALGAIGDKRAIEPLAAALANGHFSDLPHTAVALSRFGDTRALQALFNLVWTDSLNTSEIPEAFELLQSKAAGNVTHGLCEKCICRSNIIEITPLNRGDLLGMSIKYIACKNCNSNLYLNEHIDHITWVLDRRMKETSRPGENNNQLEVNALKHKNYIDFDEIRIIDADDYQVEKFVLKLLDDMDDYRRNRYGQIPVYLSPTLSLSPAKINLLRDHFEVRSN